MDMSKSPKEMNDLELSTAVYHLAVRNQEGMKFTLSKAMEILLEASKRLSPPLKSSINSGAATESSIDLPKLPEDEQAPFTSHPHTQEIDAVSGDQRRYTQPRKASHPDFEELVEMHRKASASLDDSWVREEDRDDFFSDPREEGKL